MGVFRVIGLSSKTYVDVEVNISRTSDHDVYAGKAHNVLEMVANHVLYCEEICFVIRDCSIKVKCTGCSMLVLLWDT